MKRQPFAVAVHGGAGRIAASLLREPHRQPYEAAMLRSLKAARSILVRGGSAVRAVVEAVAVLEDDEILNAGRGAALCADGSVELSASVMNGRTLEAGAMVGLRRTKNPIRAARSLMGHSHCLLFGEYADAFAERAGLEMVPRDYFYTRARTKQWKQHGDRMKLALDHSVDDGHGTVGAVALDRRGTLAAATSTGGLVNQLPGRVGDSPVVGAGTWANRFCAVSASGTGEAFFRVSFGRRVADLVELAGLTLEDAARQALGEVLQIKGVGGCIAVDASGRVSCSFNSSQMVRGWIEDGSLSVVGIDPDPVEVACAASAAQDLERST